jgi:ribose 1,5-bisphosphokinase
VPRSRRRGIEPRVAGVLVLVVGPSGAGKDTMIDCARQALAGDPRFRFIRRVITRPADAAGEAHEAVTEGEFAARSFALSWRAHGLCYGIPAEMAADLARGAVVVANISRTVIVEAARRFPARVIAVTAPAEVLAARLAARGREAASDAASRLARAVALPAGVPVETVANDSTLEMGVARFLAALSRAAAAARPGGTAPLLPPG